MIITQINDIKWVSSVIANHSVPVELAFETHVLYLILTFIKEDCLPDYKHKVNYNDLINNDICGVLIMNTNKQLVGALKAACLNFLKNNVYAPNQDSWTQILKAVKSTNSLQIFATGFIIKRSSNYQLRVSALIAKKQTEQFINERINESIRNALFILHKFYSTFA